MTALVFRIITHTQADRTIVVIAGQMADEDAKGLQRVRKSVGSTVSLDLRGLAACGPDCVRVLREWLAEGARLEEASPFLAMVLREPPQPPTAPTSSGR